MKITAPVYETIELSSDPPPATVEERLRSAIYSAAVYHHVTRIRCGHQTVYIVPEWNFEEEPLPTLISDEREGE